MAREFRLYFMEVVDRGLLQVATVNLNHQLSPLLAMGEKASLSEEEVKRLLGGVGDAMQGAKLKIDLVGMRAMGTDWTPCPIKAAADLLAQSTEGQP